MDFDKFIAFIWKNIEHLEIEDVKLIISWNYNQLFRTLNQRYVSEEDSKKKAKYETIVLFLNDFLEDYQKNSYKYSYDKSEQIEHYVYWFDFYVKNSLLKNASQVITQMDEKFPENKEWTSLRKKLEKLQKKYSNEYEKTKWVVEKNNKLKHIEWLVWQWEYGKAMYESLKFLQEYPDDAKIKQYLKKIDDMKTSNVLESIDINKDFFDKVWLLHLSKKSELEKWDIKDIYSKLKGLISRSDYEAWLMLVKYIRDKYWYEDPKLLKYYNRFIDIKTKLQQSKEEEEYNLELKSLYLLIKNKQLQDALIKANSILKKYPFIDKKKVFEIINKINKQRKQIVNSKAKTKMQASLDNFLMSLSPLTQKWIFMFYEKMSWFLRAKMDLKLSLQIIFYQTKDLWVKKFVKNILDWIDSWMKISEVLRWYSQIQQIDVSLIKIWESTWKLGDMFQAIYYSHKESIDRAKKIKSVMIYPMIVIFITFAVFIWLLVFIIPKFVGFYQDMGMKLPALTQFMIDASDIVINKWYMLILSFIGIYIFFKLFAKTKVGKYVLWYFSLKFPVIKEVVYRKYIIYFSINLSMLLKSWISLLQAIDLLTEWVENLYYKEEFRRVRFELESWMSFAKSLWLWNIQDVWEYSNNYIPIDFAYAVDVWEKTWQLWELLEDVWKRYDEDLKLIIKNMQSLMEPFVIVLVWWVVFVFVLSIFLPMINLYNMVWKMWWM